MYHVITFVNNNTSFNCILSILSLNFILLSMPNEFWLESRLCNIAYAPCTSLHFPSMYHVYHLKSGLNVRSIFMIRSIIRYASNYTLLCKRILKVGLLVTYFTCHDTSNKNKCVKILESIHHSTGFSSSKKKKTS